MSALKGDFIGFTFNGHHSSEYGLVRTSDGSRYIHNLLPSYSDKTTEVPGGDGTYYRGTNFTQRIFDIPVAFDSMTEKQKRDLGTLLGDRTPRDLIFDEEPYKAYKVKISGNPSLNYLCFDENGQRIYKGEGTLSFVAYYPYGRSVHKFLSDFSDSNKSEWAAASNMQQYGTSFDTFNGGHAYLYNAGDIEADFILKFSFSSSSTLPNIYINLLNKPEYQLNINAIAKKDSDIGVQVNSRNHLIEGIDEEGKITGTVYNEYISSGNFFKIPRGESQMQISGGANPTGIEYDYLYY